MEPLVRNHRDHPEPKPKARRFLVRLLRVVSVIPVLGAGAYLLFFAPSPASVSIVNATVETFSFEVSAPELTKFPLGGFNIVNDDPLARPAPTQAKLKKPAVAPKFLCFAGTILPSAGTRITYTRFGEDPVQIRLERADGKPVGQFQSASQSVPDVLKTSSRIRMTAVDKDDESAADTNCEGRPVPRLPVYGFGDVGSEKDVSGQPGGNGLGTLIEGTVDVLAHTVHLSSTTPAPSSIYSTNSQVVLPPGSSLVQFPSEGEAPRPWVGFAMTSDSSIELHVTSDAARLAIVRPGEEARPEVLSVGLLTQVYNDPFLASMQIVGALLFSMFQVLGMFFSADPTRRPF